MARYHSAGTTFSRSTDGSSYTAVSNAFSVSISGAEKEQQEATALADAARTYVDGLPGFGRAQVQIYDDPDAAVEQNLLADFAASNTSRYWKIAHPKASSTVGDITFQGPVVGWEINHEANAPIRATITIQISGAITRATS